MSLFRTILFVAALAGIGAGILISAVHLFTTVPLIIQAETFEGSGEEVAAAPAHEHAPGAEAHAHDGEEWGPADGIERNGLTVIFTVLTGFGFALLLVAASEIAGGLKGWHQGMLWGLAGFAVFTLAPGLGLPPELPAMPAAEVVPRQIWWVGTAAATAAGLALIVFGRSPLLAILGIVLIVAPQFIGAPQPDSYETPIPESLHHSFMVASIMVSFLFWVLLGGLAGWLRPRLADRAA
jgi:cobalt transporter subunit CbtA